MSDQMIVLVAFDGFIFVLLVLALIQLRQGQRWAEQDHKRVLASRRALPGGEE